MLLGERIRLRAITKDDLQLCVRWLNDEEVRRSINIYTPLSIEQEDDWFAHISKQPVEEYPLIIEVKEGENWVSIGNVAFVNYSTRERSAEFGIFIGEKQYWEKGYGREATKLMLKHGFSNLNLHRIYLRVFETNPRAIHCYEQAGFIHEGRFRQAGFQDGKYIDLLIMSVLFPEWQEGE